MTKCGECHGEGAYWTDWGDTPLTEMVLEPPTDDPLAYVVCHVCDGLGEVDDDDR